MANTAYDLVVIGGGPGGYVAAIRAAQLGMRVACVEKDSALGGTCLNVGCIPSKALLDSSERYHEAKQALRVHGVIVGTVELDLNAMMARKDKVVQTNTRGVATLFRKHKIEWLQGTGRLLGANSVRVEGPEPRTVDATRILLASGSAPVALPAFPFDGRQIVSSTEALSLPQIPKRLVVVGAGAVGLELGSVWRRLGSEVVVVEVLDRIVAGMDAEMGAGLQKALERQGMKFRLKTSAARLERNGGELRVGLQSDGKNDEERCDVMLVAVGRRPYTEGLGLEAAAVATDERGRIRVDAHYATNVPTIFAIGDVIAGPMLAHKAMDEGVAAVEGMAGMGGHVNYDAIPNVVYTAPELASVGAAEEEARRLGHDVRVGSFPFLANGRARCMNDTTGGVKIVADAKTDRILGIHILGPHASDLIAEAAVAMEFGASAEDIARSAHAHPTLAEAVKEAALAVADRPLHR
jgi:dihydrolipoamide dehydrogenase